MIVGIIGCGTMGSGIAQVAASNNNKVVVVDTNEIALQKAQEAMRLAIDKLVSKGKIDAEMGAKILNNITWTSSMSTLTESSLIIEAIVEKIEIKQSLFQSVESIVTDSCILASNTSSLSITSIASSCRIPERVIGIHFFNPATLMQLVEIVPALQTREQITTEAKRIIDSWGKTTVLAKDTPGFIVNRIARPFYSEAIRIHEEGTPIEIIDQALKTIGGFKMGPFELMDLIGHDVNYAVTESVWTSFFYDQKYTPSFTQKRLVEAKWLGRKSGRGFYNYTEDATSLNTQPDLRTMQTIFDRVIVMLINEAANALFLKVASKDDIELAMTKGVNYPKGLLQWANEIGLKNVVNKLDELYQLYQEDRYRCTPALRNNDRF
ncbi:MAG: 3-hydroxybutyryl-CoA dehydrogenase [Bacteroidetes bacterium]|nr:3-hydroxybutyryl-CoA dehydrogenase [Bacteroidota bacterium]MBP6314529.1 3-hydroxybutyryl-CoA dehydrogenase [Chitinophagaceae bacterium]